MNSKKETSVPRMVQYLQFTVLAIYSLFAGTFCIGCFVVWLTR